VKGKDFFQIYLVSRKFKIMSHGDWTFSLGRQMMDLFAHMEDVSEEVWIRTTE